MIHVGPAQAREVLDRLESEIVDPQRARGGDPVTDAEGRSGARVPAPYEPPD